jgi:hypothetical protein
LSKDRHAVSNVSRLCCCCCCCCCCCWAAMAAALRVGCCCCGPVGRRWRPVWMWSAGDVRPVTFALHRCMH